MTVAEAAEVALVEAVAEVALTVVDVEVVVAEVDLTVEVGVVVAVARRIVGDSETSKEER